MSAPPRVLAERRDGAWRAPRELAFAIRTALAADGAALAGLCEQVGHAVAPDQVVERLALIRGHGAGMVIVAVGADGRVLGWLHVAPHYSLGAPPQAEILGLVVDRQVRGARIGTALLGAAELWARERQLHHMQVRSDLVRAEADHFYRERGYRHVLEQQLFRKPLA